MDRRVSLVLAVLAVSMGAPFARWAAPAPAIAIAALRVGFAAVLLLIASGRDVRRLARLPRGQWPLVVLSGALLALHFGTWIASLTLTSTAASVTLVSTSPMFATAYGVLVGDRPRPRELLGIAIATAGCAILAGGDWRAGGDALIGDGLALVGAVAATAYLAVGRNLRAALPLLPYLGAVNAVAAACLVIAAIATRAPLTHLPGQAYLACLGAAFLASMIGHSLLNAAVRVTPTHLVTLALLGEPIGSALITWAAFDEPPPLHAAAGGAIILAGIALGFARRAADQRP